MSSDKMSRVRYSAVNATKAPPKSKWTSLLAPATMLIAFLLGVGFAVGHHCYYAWLDKQIVGDASRQQWSLRIVNFFAVATSVCLKFSVGIAYFQIVWYKLKRNFVSLKTIDNSFDALGNILSFLDLELLSKLNYAIPIAIVVWLLPLISLFPPATLSVALNTYQNQITHSIRVPGILNNTTPVGGYTGTIKIGDVPIPQLEQEIFTYTAVNGEIIDPLDLDFGAKTYTNYSYSTSMILPRLRCTTQTVTELDEPLRNATVLAFGKDGVCDGCPPCISSMDPATWSLYANCSGQEQRMQGLYIGLTYINDNDFPRKQIVPSLPSSDNSDGNIILIVAPNSSHATVSNCTATNSTVDFTVRYTDGTPTITTDNIVDHGTYWEYDQAGDISRIMDFLPVSRWVNGIFGWVGGYKSNYVSDTGGSLYVTGSVQGTVFRLARDFYEVANATGAIQLPDASLVRDTTMADMLEQLSLNVTYSYMSQEMLSYETPAQVQISSTENVYSYHPENLYISYGAGIFISLVSIIIGTISFWRNGVHLENRASTMGALMQHQYVSSLLRGKAGVGLGKNVESTELRLENTHEQGIEFVPKG